MLAEIGALVVKASAVAAAITLVGGAAAKSSPKLAGVLLGMPLGVGPAMVLLAMTKSADFVAESALYSAANAAGAFAVLIGYTISASTVGHWAAVAVALVCWSVVSVVLGVVGVTVWSAALVVVVAYLATHHVVRRVSIPRPPLITPTWWQLIARGMVSGFTVTGIVSFAQTLDSSAAGLLAAAPVYWLSSSWMLYGIGGRDLVLATLSRADRGMWSYVAFCFTVHFTAGSVYVAWALALALIASIATSLAIYASDARRT